MTDLQLVAVAAIAALLDIATTCIVVRMGGQEANPLQRALFRRLGPLPSMVMTHGLVLLALLLLHAGAGAAIAAIAWLACAVRNARNAAILCRQK